MCHPEKNTNENIGNTKTYNISEQKFVKLVILSICDNVDDGFAEFKILEENERFIKQIVGQIYEKGNTQKILNLIELVPEIEKKYALIVALYDKIMLKKDDTSSSLIYDFLHKLNSHESFIDLDIDTQKNIEVMMNVLEMIVTRHNAQYDTDGSSGATSMPPFQHHDVLFEIQKNMIKIQKQVAKLEEIKDAPYLTHQNVLLEIQEDVNKMKKHVAEFEEMKAKIDIDKITTAFDYITLQLDTIQSEKNKIIEWNSSLEDWVKEPVQNFKPILSMAIKLKEFSNYVSVENKKSVNELKMKIPQDIRWIVWMDGVYLKYGSTYMAIMQIPMNSTEPFSITGAPTREEKSKWVFEVNVNGEGLFIRNSSTQAYLYDGRQAYPNGGCQVYFYNGCTSSSSQNPIKAMSKKHCTRDSDLDFFRWILQRLGDDKYNITNLATKRSMTIVDSYGHQNYNQYSYSKNWMIEK